jgi:hypothetical protein
MGHRRKAEAIFKSDFAVPNALPRYWNQAVRSVHMTLTGRPPSMGKATQLSPRFHDRPCFRAEVSLSIVSSSVRSVHRQLAQVVDEKDSRARVHLGRVVDVATMKNGVSAERRDNRPMLELRK